jgi:glycosyltransferase involved in cell wall biosynthesis
MSNGLAILPKNMTNFEKIALITPELVEHPRIGFDLRLYQIQVLLKRMVAEKVVIWDLSASQMDKDRLLNFGRDGGSLLGGSIAFSKDLVAIGLHLWPDFRVQGTDTITRNSILRWLDREQAGVAILVHPHGTDLLPELKRRGVRVFVDCHNVESDNIRLMYNLAQSAMQKVKVVLRWITYRRWEQRLFPLADEIWLPSEYDCRQQSLICEDRIRVRCVPNALDVNSYNPCQLRRSSDIVFPGSFGYPPNMEAASVLSDRVLPDVRKSFPNARLILVGRDSEGQARMLQRPNEVIVTGEVRDTRPYLCEAGVVAAPILHGSGTRFKILEALALGLPVVTTPLGCQGLAVEDSQHLLIRAVDHFAEAISFLLKNPEWASELGRNGRKLIEMNYTWDCVESQLRTALDLASVHNQMISA